MNTDVHYQKRSVSTRLSGDTLEQVRSIIYAPRFSNLEHSLDYLHQINSAHVLMLCSEEIIDRTTAKRLANDLLSIEAQGAASIPMDTNKEDVYFNFEAYLISRVGELVGGRIHTARSRNDIMATTERMAARDCLLRLVDALLRMLTSMLEKAQEHVEAIMPGYTHLQPAQPMTYGFYLHGLAHAFLRDVRRLLDAYRRTNQCPMGAGAFAGVTFPIKRDVTAQLLGFDGVVENALDAVASRDFSLEIMGALLVFSTNWSRVAQDYYVWGTEEFGLFHFPDSIASTSSIMPQKKNPVVLEYLKGRSGHVMGALFSAAAAIKGSGFSHAGDSNRESLIGFRTTIDECQRAAELFQLLFEQVTPCTAVMRAKAADNFCCVTDLADLLVREHDISFRQAHHVVGRVVRLALDAGVSAQSISTAMVSRAAQEVLQRPLLVPEARLRSALDPDACVRARPAGGPDPLTMTTAIQALSKCVAQLRQESDEYRETLAKADVERQRQLKKLAQS